MAFWPHKSSAPDRATAKGHCKPLLRRTGGWRRKDRIFDVSNKSPLVNGGGGRRAKSNASLCRGLSWVQSCLDGSIYQALKVKQICNGSSLSLCHTIRVGEGVHKSSPCLPLRISVTLCNDPAATDASLDIYKSMIIHAASSDYACQLLLSTCWHNTGREKCLSEWMSNPQHVQYITYENVHIVYLK